MANESKTTSTITTSNNAAVTDKIVFVKDPSGSPLTRIITVENLLNNTVNLAVSANLTLTDTRTPANSTITVKQGTLFFDSEYLYIATANNVLKRVALSAF